MSTLLIPAFASDGTLRDASETSRKAVTESITATRGVASVADLSNLTPYSGQIASTQAYIAGGTDGGNSYIWKPSDTATSDGCLVIDDGTNAGRWHAMVKSEITLAQCGMVGDGTVDDSARFSAALGCGASLRGSPSHTYRIASPVSCTGRVAIDGRNCTFLADCTGDMLTITGSVDISRVAFDGNDKRELERFVLSSGANTTHSFEKCSFRDMRSDTFASAVSVATSTVKSVVFSDCNFESIRAKADSTIGNTNGASRAVYLSCSASSVTIAGCVFDGVNSVDASDVVVHEDGDAIQIASSSIGELKVDNCNFSSVGKRAIKSQGAKVVTVSNCSCDSAWASGSTGMNSFATFFDGKAEVLNCHLTGGPSAYFVEAGSDGDGSISLRGCSWHPDNSDSTVNGLTRYFLWHEMQSVYIEKCSATKINGGIFTFTSNGYARRIMVIDSQFATLGVFANIFSNMQVWVTGSELSKDSDSTSTTSQILYVADGFNSLFVDRCSLDGHRDGVYIAAQTGTDWRANVTNCRGSVTNHVRNFDVGYLLHQSGNSWLPIEAYGSGSPEGVLSAVVASRYWRTDGGSSTTLYVKESGTGNTGWVAK